MPALEALSADFPVFLFLIVIVAVSIMEKLAGFAEFGRLFFADRTFEALGDILVGVKLRMLLTVAGALVPATGLAVLIPLLVHNLLGVNVWGFLFDVGVVVVPLGVGDVGGLENPGAGVVFEVVVLLGEVPADDLADFLPWVNLSPVIELGLILEGLVILA